MYRRRPNVSFLHCKCSAEENKAFFSYKDKSRYLYLNSPMVVYHILAWGIPLEFITIIEAVNLAKYSKT